MRTLTGRSWFFSKTPFPRSNLGKALKVSRSLARESGSFRSLRAFESSNRLKIDLKAPRVAFSSESKARFVFIFDF